MRIRARPSRRQTDRITLNLASMIDVTFLLLIYFMVVTIIMDPEDRFMPTLQTRAVDAPGDLEAQVLEVRVVDGAPAYQIGGRFLANREELAGVLRELPAEAGLLVNVHEGVPVGFAVAAIQEARDAGFEQVTYVPQ